MTRQDRKIESSLFPGWKPKTPPDWFGKYGLRKNTDAIRRWSLIETAVNEAVSDGLENVTPMIIALVKPIPAIRAEYGRGTWKRIHHSPFSTNAILLKMLLQPEVTVDQVMALPDKLHKSSARLITSVGLDITTHALRVSGKQPPNGVARLIVDTIRIGVHVNPDWSLTRIQKEHDKAIRDREIKSADPTPWAPAWSCEIDGYHFELLRSALDFATEGQSQRHSVSRYARAARLGHEVVFRITGRERGTTSKAKGGDHVQVTAFANHAVSRTCRQAAIKAHAAYLSDQNRNIEKMEGA